MEERRRVGRVDYRIPSVIVVCDTEEKIYVEVVNMSPMGMGILMPAGIPNLLGQNIIVVTDTIIMYAEVNRLEERPDGNYMAGVEAIKFTPEVLQYLFEHIG